MGDRWSGDIRETRRRRLLGSHGFYSIALADVRAFLPSAYAAALFYPRPFPFVLSAHICAVRRRMTGSEFERQVRALARRRGVIVSFDRRAGKVVTAVCITAIVLQR